MTFWNWLKSLFVSRETPKIKGALVLIVGHNAKAPGAYGVAPLSMNEYPYNKNLVAPECVKYGAEKGLKVEVLLKDTMSTSVVGPKASSIVKAAGKGCVIELHFNAYNGSASGTETLYNTKLSDNKKFAEIVQKKMVAVFKRPDRGLKLRNTGRGASNLAAVTVPVCLVEPLFGDNTTDAGLLKSKAKEYARSLVDGAIEFLQTKA